MTPGKNWENLKKNLLQIIRMIQIKCSFTFSGQQKTVATEAETGGVDLAVQYLEPDYIIIANPDVQVSDACILRVADALEKQEDGAVASAMVVDVKGQSSFSYWDLQSVWLDLLDTGLVTRRLFRAFLKTPLEKLPLAADGVSRMVGALPGSFFMVKTGCFTPKLKELFVNMYFLY